MDHNQQTPVTDDQELANVLAGMNQQVNQPAPVLDDDTPADAPAADTALPETPELQFEETGDTTTDTSGIVPGDPTLNILPEVELPAAEVQTEAIISVAPLDPAPLVTPSVVADPAPSTSPELDSIKKEALEALRPLVDRLDLPADEKFDTLLLLIRSTDDKSLVNATFEAAKGITDETKRAQALLDVIKEIDYFGAQK